MSDPIALSTTQQFELERLSRLIDSAADMTALRALSKQLLQAWQTQKAATQWLMRQNLPGQHQAARSAAAARLSQPTGLATSPQPARSGWDLVL